MVPKVLHRVARNTASLLTSELTNRASTFIVYALVGRYLGTVAFGQLSLALTFFYLFQVCAVAGLRSFVTREVAKDKTTASQYVLHGGIIVAAFSLGSFAILMLVVWLMGYATDTAFCIILLSLGLFPTTFAMVCESVLQAWERMHYIAYVQVPVHVMKVVLAFVLLSRGFSLHSIIGVLLAAHLAIAAVEWWVIRRSTLFVPGHVDVDLCWNLIKAASTFLRIDIIIATASSIDMLSLSKFGSERDVALFNAARQLFTPMQMICLNFQMSLFPLLCRKYASSFRDLQEFYEQVLEVLLFVTLPVVIGLFFFADGILALLYGEKFVPASIAVRIMVWHLLLTTLTGLLGQVLVASQHEKITLRIVAIDWVVHAVCAMLLVSTCGLIGAALSGLLTRLVDVCFHGIFVSRLLAKLRVLRLAWKPVVASLGMLLPLLGINYEGRILALICAGIVYATVVLAMTLWESGGVAQMKTRYLSLWVE